jgi:beta-glucanase (GH16 family)
MKNAIKIISIIMFFGCACKQDPVPFSPLEGNWELQKTFSDEFNEPVLDTGKWDNDVGDWGKWSWEPYNAYLKDGNLHLMMEYNEHFREDEKLYYKSGIIKSKATPIKYGYFEARIRAAERQPGVCPAFWVYRDELDKWTEIDFVELTQFKDKLKQADFVLHVMKHPDLEEYFHKNQPWTAPWDPADDFHIYGCSWDEKEIQFFVDGVLRSTADNLYHDQALDVVLSMGVRSPLRDGSPSPEGFPTEMMVDYIRVWKLEPK